ncbi:hypothetical protein NC651_037799 [Populus alba x Populus x berolinensis]|uniref:Uncharacterized protein n=1 Tax=Populus alba x Populus x berolinensis TaxID=444605 RepID=A0AAD6PVE6_9ROSI|nr:hypothetical protein NC651_037273 [Populus alba x Populus x berolinensis]KAJ6861851.1 hypothetical protein NC651_037798 [Populus alba x Populus x berolinensis]KAJ6861852.1 hypothetical protein NC651_037799 [Populus alba x Populus x berolinensis]KAJ6960957.1 hypothetical protein NC653_038841 [Populus alba x Populus x berolinensis]
MVLVWGKSHVCGWKDCFHIKTFTWRKARALENFNHCFGIASLHIFF